MPVAAKETWSVPDFALQRSHCFLSEDEVGPGLRLVGEISQQVGRMVGDDARPAGVAVEAPAEAGDAGVGLEERLRGEAAHRDDELGAHQLDLAQQMRRAL